MRESLRAGAIAAIASLLACASTGRPPERAVAPPRATREAPPAAVPEAIAKTKNARESSVYLPPERAGGSPYYLDPESDALRVAVKCAPPKADDRLDAADLADDVRDLHAAMAKLYAGYPELLQRASFDVDRFFADWERDVRAAGATITFDAGITQPLIALRRHHTDLHLRAYGGASLDDVPELAFAEYQAPGRVVGFDAARCTFEGAVPVAGTVRVVRVLGAGGFGELSTFSAQSNAPLATVRCGDQATPFRRRPPHPVRVGHDGPAYEWHVVRNATVITVRRLAGSPDDRALLERIAADAPEHAKRPLIVFDFRGNGGGDDDYVINWIAKLVRGTWPAEYAALHVTAAARVGDWNQLVLRQIAYGLVDTPAGKAARDAFQDASPLGIVAGDPVQVMERAPNSANAARPYGGRVVAIVDRDSASSGESAPNALRAGMHALLVGERTGGLAEYGNVRHYVMPRTHVIWGLASKRNYYDEPREGVGFPVDLVLDADLLAAPVEELLPLLERLPKPR